VESLNCRPDDLLHKRGFRRLEWRGSEIEDLVGRLMDFSSDVALFLIGSRTGDHREYSDWDIGIASKR